MVAVDKLVRLITIIVCLVFTVIGAALSSPKAGSEYFIACCVFCVFLLIIPAYFGHGVHVVSIAFVLTCSPYLTSVAQFETDSKILAGYSLILIGMWTSFFFIFEDTIQKCIDLVTKNFFSSPENILGFVAVLLNLLGCIILWSHKSLVGLGTAGFLSSGLFIAAWYFRGPTSMWVGLFWFAYYQYTVFAACLSGLCDSSANSNAFNGSCTSGTIFQWVAHLVFLSFLLYLARGKAGNSMVSEASDQLKNTQYLVQFIVVVACLVGVILGAIVANDNTTKATGWQATNAVLCVVFLLCAILQSEQRETSCFFVALALVIVTSADLAARADSSNVPGGNDRIVGGNSLMLISMWLAFVVCAVPAFRPNMAGVQVTAPLIMGAIGVCVIYWVGLLCFWAYIHYAGNVAGVCFACSGAGVVEQSILCGLCLVLFIWAGIFKRGGHTAMICAFYASILHISPLSTALAYRSDKEGSGPGEYPHLNTLRAAVSLEWIALICVIAICLYYYVEKPISALGGSDTSSGGSSSGQSSADKPMTAVVTTTTTTTTTTTAPAAAAPAPIAVSQPIQQQQQPPAAVSEQPGAAPAQAVVTVREETTTTTTTNA